MLEQVSYHNIRGLSKGMRVLSLTNIELNPSAHQLSMAKQTPWGSDVKHKIDKHSYLSRTVWTDNYYANRQIIKAPTLEVRVQIKNQQISHDWFIIWPSNRRAAPLHYHIKPRTRFNFIILIKWALSAEQIFYYLAPLNIQKSIYWQTKVEFT